MIRLLILLIALGVVAWLVTLLPLPAPFHVLIWVVLVLALIWEVLALAGYVRSALPGRPPP